MSIFLPRDTSINTFVKIHLEDVHFLEALFEFVLGAGGNWIHIFVLTVVILNGMGVKDLNLTKSGDNVEEKALEYYVL